MNYSCSVGAPVTSSCIQDVSGRTSCSNLNLDSSLVIEGGIEEAVAAVVVVVVVLAVVLPWLIALAAAPSVEPWRR